MIKEHLKDLLVGGLHHFMSVYLGNFLILSAGEAILKVPLGRGPDRDWIIRISSIADK
jgi:hypothetical protein